jgi:hypothetical protein
MGLARVVLEADRHPAGVQVESHFGGAVEPRKAAVPSVGCPANGSSSCTVKMDPDAAFPFDGGSRGDEGGLERFISRARACMCRSLSRVRRENTAREFPSKWREEKRQLHEGKRVARAMAISL